MAADLLRVERALLGNLQIDELAPDEKVIFQREKAAFEVGQMANRFAQGYYAHATAGIVAREPSAKEALTNRKPGHPIPVETVKRKNGTEHTFDSHHYLEYFKAPEIENEVASIWLVGSLLTLGDALSRNKYFDHMPELELVYHLRNGIAHGNRFHFLKPGLERLQKHPAHNRTASGRFGVEEFVIAPNLHGKQVLFDFMGPGDVLDLLQFISFHLTYLRGRLP